MCIQEEASSSYEISLTVLLLRANLPPPPRVLRTCGYQGKAAQGHQRPDFPTFFLRTCPLPATLHTLNIIRAGES